MLGRTTYARVQWRKPRALGENSSIDRVLTSKMNSHYRSGSELDVWMFVNRINGFTTPLYLQDELSNGRGGKVYAQG